MGKSGIWQNKCVNSEREKTSVAKLHFSSTDTKQPI